MDSQVNAHACCLDDFKPASVDTSKPGNLEVGDGGEVTVSLPNIQVY